MKIADLYIRVDSEEDSDKDLAQRKQEDSLKEYCINNDIEIRYIIYEDYSAETFERPAWAKLLSILRKKRKQSDMILFTHWDKFSRNMANAYQMITTLQRLGVRPYAIVQDNYIAELGATAKLKL
ncbi:recombinase family protein [Sphingobacterium sp. PCS056]|uniref:recombinase family protein n=1 Tax=Sphingobacterium sp. PCS056 TaxID=2931400 RepID=UPI002010BD3D|nr:recombinase family protein [Sphingobacterium sp. PCS056]UPZ36539.1 recombinase family protein [Sphingobacterium sp. PCS056]